MYMPPIYVIFQWVSITIAILPIGLRRSLWLLYFMLFYEFHSVLKQNRAYLFYTLLWVIYTSINYTSISGRYETQHLTSRLGSCWVMRYLFILYSLLSYFILYSFMSYFILYSFMSFIPMLPPQTQGEEWLFYTLWLSIGFLF
jgi:hypothetical protein